MNKMNNVEFDELKTKFSQVIKSLGGKGLKFERVENVTKSQLAGFLEFILNNGFNQLTDVIEIDEYNKKIRYGFIAVSHKERSTREILVEVRKWHNDDTYTISYSKLGAHPRNKTGKVECKFNYNLHRIL